MPSLQNYRYNNFAAVNNLASLPVSASPALGPIVDVSQRDTSLMPQSATAATRSPYSNIPLAYSVGARNDLPAPDLPPLEGEAPAIPIPLRATSAITPRHPVAKAPVVPLRALPVAPRAQVPQEIVNQQNGVNLGRGMGGTYLDRGQHIAQRGSDNMLQAFSNSGMGQANVARQPDELTMGPSRYLTNQAVAQRFGSIPAYRSIVAQGTRDWRSLGNSTIRRYPMVPPIASPEVMAAPVYGTS